MGAPAFAAERQDVGGSMGKALTNTQQAEYDRLKAFLAVACEGGLPSSLPLEGHPLVVLEGLHGHSPIRALGGLREAVRDMVEAYEHASGVERDRLEALLAEAGAPSLQSMRGGRSRAIFAIVERGEIQSDDEWRLISSALSDTTDRLLSGVSRDVANDLVARYEDSKT